MVGARGGALLSEALDILPNEQLIVEAQDRFAPIEPSLFEASAPSTITTLPICTPGVLQKQRAEGARAMFAMRLDVDSCKCMIKWNFGFTSSSG